MKNSFFSILVVFLLISSESSSQIHQTWVKRYVGPYRFDESLALKINNYGDPVITGLSEYASGNIECPVIKYDQCSGNSTMDIIHNFNFANLESGSDITIDNSNNIYLTGETYISALGYYTDILYGKYNNNLSRVFLNYYGGLGTQFPKKIKLDAQGNIYIGGVNQQTTGPYEFLLVKFNNNGVYQWARTYNNGDQYSRSYS